MLVNVNTEMLEQIALAKRGNKLAFENLYKELYSPLFKYVLFKTKNKDLSEDIVSQTFMNWYQSLENYEIKSKPINYLIMIANRLMINEGVRKKAEYLSEDTDEFVADKSESIENLLDISVDFEKVRVIIEESLNEIEKEIIYLKYIHDKTNSEIAKITDKKEGNVRVIEYRALTKIRNIYKQKYD